MARGEWSEIQGGGRPYTTYGPLSGPCLLLWGILWEPQEGVEQRKDMFDFLWLGRNGRMGERVWTAQP